MASYATVLKRKGSSVPQTTVCDSLKKSKEVKRVLTSEARRADGGGGVIGKAASSSSPSASLSA